MKTSEQRKQLLALHCSQQRLFARTVKSIQREFGKLAEAQEFLATVSRLAELLNKQTEAFQGMLSVAEEAALPVGNNSAALMAKMTAGQPYYYLTNKRHLAEHIGDLDEWKKALGCVSKIMKKARPFEHSDAKIWEDACAMGWNLSAGQDQIHSLARYTQAITSTQEALLRSYGLKIWQGRGRILRWEGDRDAQR